ncbi:MAG: hypothetical protein AAFU61_12240, partial [Pseudomonadota bacterium]
MTAPSTGSDAGAPRPLLTAAEGYPALEDAMLDAREAAWLEGAVEDGEGALAQVLAGVAALPDDADPSVPLRQAKRR